MWLECASGVGDKLLAQHCVPEEIDNRVLQFRFRTDLDGAAMSDQRPRKGGKIFHVRTEDDRSSGDDRLDRVLSALSSEAFSDENNRGDPVPISQLTG